MSGKTGFCSICRHPKVKVINEVIAGGGSYSAALDRGEEFGIKFAKATFYNHKSHATSTLITDAEKARKNPIMPTGPGSNRGFLEAIRDLGMKKALENPETVTVNQALRAASILSDKEGKHVAIEIVLAKALQGTPPELIEGSWSEASGRSDRSEVQEIKQLETQEAG